MDGRFHAVLYEASGSRMLKHVLTDFHNYVQRARKSSIVSEEEPESRYVNTDRFYVRSKTEMQRWQNSLLMSIYSCNAKFEKAGILDCKSTATSEAV